MTDSRLKKYGSQIFDALSPIYLLDTNYCFVDWNQCFDFLFAQPLSLSKGCHVGDFVNHFANSQEVYDRAASVFGVAQTPHRDIEPLSIDLKKYGLTHFQKIATQILNDDGSQEMWAINLNICSSENIERLWEDLQNLPQPQT
jgi:hypothetical protein